MSREERRLKEKREKHQENQTETVLQGEERERKRRAGRTFP